LSLRWERSAWLLLAPTLLVLLLVAAWPLGRTLWLSLTDASLMDLSAALPVGLDNYLSRYEGLWEGVLADPLWWRSVRNTLVFAAVSVSLETVLGLGIALALTAARPGRALLRAAVLVPWAIPTVVSARLWGWMYHDQFGLLNDLLLRLGLIAQPLAWTADPDLAMTAVVLADVWKTTPFMALLLLAALQMRPQECYEAARVDGVHPLRLFFRVTLPLIRPALVVAVVFRTLDALRVFDLVYVLTPNSEDTLSMSVYARQQLVDFQDVGYGSAASTLLSFVAALTTLLLLRLTRFRPAGGTA
jgi:trehalose/maltose transport system permease protein